MFKIIEKALPVLLSISSVLFLCSCSQIKNNSSSNKAHSFSAEVEVIEIGKDSFTNKLKATGSLESPQSTELTSEIAGKIIYLNIPEGQFVNEGHTLARVNNTTNQAEIEVAKAKLENAQTNHNRMKSLKEEGAVSQQTLDNTLEVLRVAEGELNRVNAVSSMTVITAPFSGVPSIRKISLGQYIDPGDPIVRISQIDPIYLLFSLPEQYIAEVMLGQEVAFNIDNKEYKAKVTVVDPYIDPNTRTVQIKATTRNPKMELLPGRFASISLNINSIKDAILIPTEALIQEGEKKQVALVSKDNVVIFQEVSISNWDKDSILVSSGLMAGDIVITSGHQKVFPGSKVTPKPYNPIHNKILDKEILE